MILQRLASAIREQNWSQIITEILIVVIGIFLGLQVTAWNDARQDRADEQKYLQRFHDEIVEELRPAIGLLRLREVRYAHLIEIAKIINGEIKAESISQDQCHSLQQAGIFSSQATPLPTMVELLSTGRLSIIQNEEIRTAISKYNVNAAAWQGNIETMRLNTFSFPEKYPEIINLDLKLAEEPFRFTAERQDTYNHVCRLDLMKENNRFKNDLVKLTGKINAFMVIFLERKADQLNILHEIVDHELGIAHEEEGS